MILSEIISGLASAALPTLFNSSPESIATSITLNPLLKEAFDIILSDMFKKNLTKREMQRLGISYVAAIEQIKENMDNKTALRSDDLFIKNEENYSKADDILETTFKNAINDTELNKSLYYGRFIGNLPFCPQIDYSNSLHLQRAISQLSYTHFCILTYMQKVGVINLSKWRIYLETNSDFKCSEIYSCFKDLKNYNLINPLPPFSLNTEMGNVRISSIGTHACTLLVLSKIPDSDISDIANCISRVPTQ